MRSSKKLFSFPGYVAAAVFCFLTLGCQSVMSSSSANQKMETVPNQWPLKFEKHNVGAACYDTYACKVFYNNHYMVKEPEDELQPSSASIGPKYLDYISGSYLGVQNFPPAAVVSWKSKDGSAHEAKIDIADIFKDQLIRHKVPQDQIPTDTVAVNDPEIIFEVNDRTINVYMRAMVFLKDTGAQRSDFRNDLMLAYSKTY
jgi:hypothetical protein